MAFLLNGTSISIYTQKYDINPSKIKIPKLNP